MDHFRTVSDTQTNELQLHRIRWPLMDEEEFERRLNNSQDNREE